MILQATAYAAHRTRYPLPCRPFDIDIHTFFRDVEFDVRDPPRCRKARKLTIVSDQGGMDGHESDSRLKIQVHLMV